MEAAAVFIITVAKAIPAFDKIYQRSVDLYFSEMNRRDENESNETEQEMEAIAASLKQPGMTDENRRILRKRLIALSRM